MKTIFITSFNPFISRNILASDVLRLLKQDQNRLIVIFVPNYKLDFFKKNFGDRNIEFIGIKVNQISFQDAFFRELGGSLVNTSTLRFHKKRRLIADKKYWRYLLSRLAMTLLSHFAVFKKLARFFDLQTITRKRFFKYFEKYHPDFIFATDVYHNDDVHVLFEAKRRGIKAIGMIRSWDNITNKGLFRARPDKLIVHNEIIRQEAIRYGDVSGKDIFISGMPQLDFYVNEKKESRERILESLRLDPNKKTILFAPHGRRFHDTDWQILEILKQARDAGRFNFPVQFIVRYPPNDMLDLGKFKPDMGFVIQHPGITFQDGTNSDRESTVADSRSLFDSLLASDAVINYGSTISIDAAFLDKPVIFVSFDGWEKGLFSRSVKKFLEYDHVQYLLSTGACAAANTQEELIEKINRYLKNPELEKFERTRLVREQCAFADGQSGRRIADFISGML